MFLNNAISFLLGHVAMSENIIFVVINWGWAGVYIESWDPVQHLTMYRWPQRTKNYLTPKVNSTMIKKSSYSSSQGL